MNREILLAQLKAFQNYLKNFVEEAKSRPRTIPTNKQKLDWDDFAIQAEYTNINSRYRNLREHISTQYPHLLLDLSSEPRESERAVEFLCREISFALDSIVNFETSSANSVSSSSFKSNNQPFTKDEIHIINNQLDDLQNKLIEAVKKEKPSPETAAPYIESIKSEIDDLKTEVTNPNLGRKDWKNHLISTMISLTFTLAFSQEARNTIFVYFQSLFIYLQQHIFFLKS